MAQDKGGGICFSYLVEIISSVDLMISNDLICSYKVYFDEVIKVLDLRIGMCGFYINPTNNRSFRMIESSSSSVLCDRVA